MSPAKKATSARSGGSSKAKKTSAKKTSKQTAAGRASAKKTRSKTAKKTTAKKTSGKASAGRTASAKKTATRKPAAKKAPAVKKAAVKQVKKGPAKTTVAPKVAPKPSIKKPVSRPAPAAPPKQKVRPAKFDKDQLAKIRSNLATKRVELEERQRELDETSFEATQSDITGEVGLDEDFADAGTATFERERDLSIRNNIRDLIDQVTRAMQRIDEGTYGTCERCGQPIDASRLKELPHASLCLDCKRREERAR